MGIPSYRIEYVYIGNPISIKNYQLETGSEHTLFYMLSKKDYGLYSVELTRNIRLSVESSSINDGIINVKIRNLEYELQFTTKAKYRELRINEILD